MPHLLPHPNRILRLAEWLDLSGLSDAAAAARCAAEELIAVVNPGAPADQARPTLAKPTLALTDAEAARAQASPQAPIVWEFSA